MRNFKKFTEEWVEKEVERIKLELKVAFYDHYVLGFPLYYLNGERITQEEFKKLNLAKNEIL